MYENKREECEMFGEELRRARHLTGLSMQALANRIGVPWRTIQDWEAGVRKPPKYTQRLILSELQNLQGKSKNGIKVDTKTITIKAPKDIRYQSTVLIQDCNLKQWDAQYKAEGGSEALLVTIESRSAIDVIVTRVSQSGLLGPQSSYYIASPNFGVAIPGISSLEDVYEIAEQLLERGMPAPDAVTVAQVLRDMGDF